MNEKYILSKNDLERELLKLEDYSISPETVKLIIKKMTPFLSEDKKSIDEVANKICQELKVKIDNMTNFDEFAQDIGFINGKDFCDLVGIVDRTDAVYRLWFSEWRSNRKGTLPFTKDGLLKLLQKIKNDKSMNNKSLNLT